MSRMSRCIRALLLSLFLPLPVFAQQLTQDNAKAMLDKLGQASATDEFTITSDQEQQLNALPPEVRSALPIQSTSPCVMDAGDRRVRAHQFVVCQGILPVGFGPQQSAFDIRLSQKFPWRIVTINLNTDDTGNSETKTVEYLWEYDFSGLPPKAAEILKGVAPHPGRSLFQLDGGAWKWVAYQ